MKKIILKLLVVLCFYLPGFQLQAEQTPRLLTVAVATNLRFSMEKLKALFEKRSGIALDLIIDSSGALTAKIENGAPFDLFLSANMDYLNYLYEKKFIVSKPKVYVLGKLVLWTRSKDIVLTPDLSCLDKNTVKTIAIANPKVAPYGKATMQLLASYGKLENLKGKFVFGSSVSMVSQFMLSQNADVAFTEKSVVLSPKIKEDKLNSWIDLDARGYLPIEQGIASLAYGLKHHPKETEDFYKFMFSLEVKTILEQDGYEIPKHN